VLWRIVPIPPTIAMPLPEAMRKSDSTRARLCSTTEKAGDLHEHQDRQRDVHDQAPQEDG
jgi:hypothetical protein